MRWVFVLVLVFPPAAYAAQPYCALPTPSPVAAALPPRPVALAGAPAGGWVATPAAPAAAVPSRPTALLPDAVASLPFVRHVASVGATLGDLGAAHGLHTVSARHGAQFMIFQLTPDGEAAVSGAMTEITPSQLMALAGEDVTRLKVEHGLRGFFVRSGQQFQVFYASPDDQRVIPGVMYDATGRDITRQQVAGIPGAIPTVQVGNTQPAATTSAATSASTPTVAALPLVQKAAAGTTGPATAPHLWMLIDPQCIYSVRAYQSLQPYVASGRLQLSVIPLSVLDYEDGGQSTKSALALLSKPADQLVGAWKAGDVSGQPSPEAPERLRANMAVAESIRLEGTPTFVWRKADGSEGRIDGMPSSVDALVSSIGS